MSSSTEQALTTPTDIPRHSTESESPSRTIGGDSKASERNLIENGPSVSSDAQASQSSQSIRYPPAVHLVEESPSTTAAVGVHTGGSTSGGYTRPNRGTASTFNGFLTPLMELTMIRLRQAMVRSFGGALSVAIQTTFIRILFLIDNANPIAWGKCSTWYFHPGRYKGSWRSHWIQNLFIRIMFLITNLINAAIQYSGVILTPAVQFHNGILTNAASDMISDGMKFSCFTNHIIQTVFLYNPGGKLGRDLVKASRLYMEDVLFASCLTSTAISILIKENAAVKLLYGIYTLFIWTDFILKRMKPRNIPRVIIAKWATEVAISTRANAPAEPPVIHSTAYEGFPIDPRKAMELMWYFTFVVANAFLRSRLYRPIGNILSSSFIGVLTKEHLA